MKHTLDILEEIASNSSKTAKVGLVRDSLSNPTFMKVLDAALNPYRTYHIKQVPSGELEHTGTMTLDEFIDSNLPLFEDRVVTGHAARDLLTECLTSLTEYDADVATRIIRRNLKAGFDASTVNKARPRTIPVYPCLLATKNTPNSIKKIKFPAYSQVKADGMRANMFFRDGDITVRGRSGKYIDLMGRFDFLSEFGDNIVTDGELVLVNDDGTFVPRAQSNGMLNKCITGTPTEDIADRVKYLVWDVISLDEFDNIDKHASKSALPYSVRWSDTIDLVDSVNSPKLDKIDTRVVDSMSDVQEHFEEVRLVGEEGLIVKNMEHPWENRRSQHLVKFKAKFECDLIVTGWNHGTVGKKWEHGVGSIRCESSDGLVVVDVNSGLSDELRAEILSTFESEWVGKIVTIAYNARETKAGSDIDSLFIPELVERREDKTVADSSSDIEFG